MSINGWIDGKVLEILEAFGVPLPGGDGDTLRAIAGHWDTMGGDLTAMTAAIDAAVRATDAKDWSGPARQAFDQHWALQKATIEKIAGSFHQVAGGLRSYAAEIDDINKSIIDICVQIAEMEVAGAALSLFTGFLSDLVANTAVATRIAKIFDLVKLFTTAAEKVGDLLEEFFQLSEELAATIKAFLTKAAELGAGFVKNFALNFTTNFAADSASAMANQALNGQPVTVSADLNTASEQALGTALFAAGGSSLAEGAGIEGTIGKVLNGEGLGGTMANGALGNIAGGLTADGLSGASLSQTVWDAGTNALTGAAGNAQNHAIATHLEANGSLGGENRSDQAKLADAAFTQSTGTALNAGVYTAGDEIETDAQNLTKDMGSL
jgi:uncharacterized protein YukE